MACFIVPAAEAVVTAAASHAVKKMEKESAEAHTDNVEKVIREKKIPFSRKLGWLTKLLAGGSILLAFEHLWHGEIVPWFPFLTNAANPADRAEMFHEMGVNGVTMAVLVTLVWAGMLAISSHFEKKELPTASDTEE